MTLPELPIGEEVHDPSVPEVDVDESFIELAHEAVVIVFSILQPYRGTEDPAVRIVDSAPDFPENAPPLLLVLIDIGVIRRVRQLLVEYRRRHLDGLDLHARRVWVVLRELEANFDGVHARKLGRQWRVRLDPHWLEPAERPTS